MCIAVGIACHGADVGKGNPGCKADRVICTTALDDPVIALTWINEIGVIAFAAPQRVVAHPAGDRVVEVSAADIVVAGGAREIGEPQEVRPTQAGAIGELEPFDL